MLIMSFIRNFLVSVSLFGVFALTLGHRHETTIDLRHIGIPVYIRNAASEETLVIESLLKEFSSGQMSSLSVLSFQKEKINSSSLGVSGLCILDIDFLKNNSGLLLKYIDAAAKIPYGILQGKSNWVGDYQECSSIDLSYNPKTKKSFKGKYSTGVLLVNGKPVFGTTSTLMLGVCLPDSCNETDVKLLMNGLFEFLENASAQIYPDISKQNFSISEVFSDSQESLDSGAIAVLILTGIIVLIVLLATFMDYGCSFKPANTVNRVDEDESTNYDNSDRSELLSGELFTQDVQVNIAKRRLLKVCQVFSLVSNAEKLFGTKIAVGPLACLNGIRVLSMWWVILGHSYGFMIYNMDNPVEAFKILQRFTFQPIINGSYSVDSFFFLSGLLVAYLALKEIREKGRLSWPYYFLHRYWRLTPLYAYVILYYTFLYSYTIFGPNRAMMSQPQSTASVDICKTKWWANLLYINNMYPNYGNLATTCIGWSWYLANDMQFYLILGPVVIITLSLPRKLKYIGVFLTIFLILLGVGIRGFIVWYYGLAFDSNVLDYMPTKHVDDPLAKNGPIYGRPYARYSVYLVGMLTGYILAMTNNRIRLNRVVAIFGWCIAIATGLSVIYGLYYYNNHPGTYMTLVQTGFYLAIGRTAWGLCLAWVVIACVSGNGGPVKDVLSWKVWAPLGRLTYAAYLVHPLVMFTYIFNMVQPVHFTDLTAIYLFISNLVVSYVVAFIVSMLVEAPMIQLEKIMLVPLQNFSENFILGPIVWLSNKVRSRFQR
ncbi:nose resistant to fluoxetine protein 6-like [Mercenaria mercenaria]|uniref:nose resistant to fluoxetine protein 6-like n=1 Tax=Mercenaria mercenaria TaxID=6596 RepID=UPI00234ED499|nr:nose resistant to fluoxetine protein 6-like [Mercenaria mercenaria]